MRVLAYRGEILGARSVSFRRVSGPREGRSCDELGEAEVSLQDTQFLGIGRVLQEVHRGFLLTSSTYDKTDPEGGQVPVE